MGNVVSIYGGKDPAEIPVYSFADVSTYLGVPRSTLRAWSGSKRYKVNGRVRTMRPLFRPDPDTGFLTFNSFVEAYLITSFTRQFGVPLTRVRRALEHVGGRRPLLDTQFHTDGVGIFVEQMGALVDASRGGQTAMREAVEDTLERVDFDATRRPLRFHPWLDNVSEPKVVSIDPRRAFGRPTIAGRSLKVDVVVDLLRSGETVETVAREYELEPSVVEAVERWGRDGAKAA